MLHVDLADLESVKSLCQTIKDEGISIDILISNAAIVPAGSRKTSQDLEEMFVVNYLAKFYLINQLLADGSIASKNGELPRIIIVSSQSHRNPDTFQWEQFGKYTEYSMGEVVKRYGYFKLLLTTFAVELSRRLNMGEEKRVLVRSLCPGPINSNIAREAPGWSKPLLKVVFSIFFRSPEKAAEPVVYFAAQDAPLDSSFDYLFLMSRVDIGDLAADPENGEKLWNLSTEFLANHGFPIP